MLETKGGLGLAAEFWPYQLLGSARVLWVAMIVTAAKSAP